MKTPSVRLMVHHNFGKKHSSIYQGEYRKRLFRIENHTTFKSDSPPSEIKKSETWYYFVDSDKEYRSFEEMVREGKKR